MYNNIGKKLKIFANIECFLGCVLSLIFGLVYALEGAKYLMFAERFPLEEIPVLVDKFPLIGLLVFVLGCLASWIGGFFTYALGELVDQATATTKELQKMNHILSHLD